MTNRTEGTYTAADGIQLRTLTWLPEGAPTGLVLLAHGLGEHGGRYDHVAAPLTAKGLAVRALDHRGHGRSGGLRGHVQRFSELTRDVHGVLQAFRAEHPDLPAVLFGHSMGGLIALAFHLDHPNHGLAGITVSNPALGVAFEPPKWKTSAGRLLSRLVPRLRLDNELDTAKLSRDPAVVSAYEQDPLVHRLISTRLYTELTGTMDRVGAAAASVRLPTLWIIGASDGITDAKASEAFARSLPADQTTVKVWSATYHEPHNDLDREEVISTFVEWATDRLAATA